MSADAKRSVLSMLDIKLTEYEQLYYANEKLFKSVGNWFYFANDVNATSLSAKGYVCYGRNRARRQAFTWPEDDKSGLVLLCRSEKADLQAIRAKCEDEKGVIVHFELTDGTKASYGVLNDAVGVFGPKDTEYPLLIIPNKPQTKIWPYSTKGNTTFDKASKEEGTLPYYVATGEIERLLPHNIKEELGIQI